MIDQKLELLSVSSTDKSAVFKVILNGEEKVFIGKVPKGYLFDSIPAVKTDSDVLKTFKFNSPMRTIDSFQKTYSIDKKVITDDDKKKDIIIPVVVSQDIVQLGNYMFSMSKMTNNTILYLLYKNRLVNRYVDDKTNITYYYLDDEFANKDSAEILAALRNENSPWSFTKFGDTENNLYAIEKKSLITSDNAELKANYKNLPGYTIFQDRQVVSEKEDEMPFSMLFEYDEDYQYTDEESQIFVNFLQLKNHLSPFFNVEVDKDNAFKAWRKFKKIANSNNTIWMTYNYETPKTLTTTTLTEDNPILAERATCNMNGKFTDYSSNNVQDYYSKYYYDSASSSYKKNPNLTDTTSKETILGFMNEKSGYNKNFDNFKNGFTLHTEFDTESIKSKILAFNHIREKLDANNGDYMTTQEIAAAVLENNSKAVVPVYNDNGEDISAEVYNDPTNKYYNPQAYCTIESKIIDESDSSKGTDLIFKVIKDIDSVAAVSNTKITLPYIIPKGTLGIGYWHGDDIIMSRDKNIGNGKYWNLDKPISSNNDTPFTYYSKGVASVTNANGEDVPNFNPADYDEIRVPESKYIGKIDENGNIAYGTRYVYNYDQKLYPTSESDSSKTPTTFFKWLFSSINYSDVGITNATGNGTAWSTPAIGGTTYGYGNLAWFSFEPNLPDGVIRFYLPYLVVAIYGEDGKNKLLDNIDPAISPEDIEDIFINNCPKTKPADDATDATKIAYILYVLDTGFYEPATNPNKVVGKHIDLSNSNIIIGINPNSELGKIYNSVTGSIKSGLKIFDPTFTTKIRIDKKIGNETVSYKIVSEQDLVRGYLYYARKYHYWHKGDSIIFRNLRIRPFMPSQLSPYISFAKYPEEYKFKNDSKYYNIWKNGCPRYNNMDEVNEAYPDPDKITEGTIISVGRGDPRRDNLTGVDGLYGTMYIFSSKEWKSLGGTARNGQPDLFSLMRVFSIMKARKYTTVPESPESYGFYTFPTLYGTSYKMVIDMFGSVIGSQFVKGQTSDSDEIINAIKQSSDKTTFVDLVVSFKDSTGQDFLSVKTYINGKLVQNNEFNKNSFEFKYLKETFTDLSNLKFNTYGRNYWETPEGSAGDTIGQFRNYPQNYVVFNYKNMAMWNYPLSTSQIKQIKDRLLTGKSINDILTDYYEVNQYNEFTQTDKDTTDKSNTTVVGRVFNIEREENTLNYTFDSENEEIYNQKLFKVQDFDYLDKLGGIHRLLVQNGRKSNLYSVRLKNTGLVPPENSGYELGTKDRQDYEAYYNECKNMLETAVKTICDKVEPVNVKLFKVMIDS